MLPRRGSRSGMAHGAGLPDMHIPGSSRRHRVAAYRDHSQGTGQVGLSKRILGELADGGLTGEVDRLVAAILPEGVVRTP